MRKKTNWRAFALVQAKEIPKKKRRRTSCFVEVAARYRRASFSRSSFQQVPFALRTECSLVPQKGRLKKKRLRPVKLAGVKKWTKRRRKRHQGCEQTTTTTRSVGV